MVVRCPECEIRLKVDAERAGKAGARFKCPKCMAVFTVAPQTTAEAAGPRTPVPDIQDSPAPSPPPSFPGAPAETTAAAGQNNAGEEIEKARRLARTILSDISLYNANVVDDAIRDDTFFDILGDEIREGVRLYNSRIPVEVRKTGDYFREAAEEFLQRKRAELGLDTQA